MTSSLEIKITINEFATPALFDAMSAVSNPRQRAALLKRLAEDSLRANVSIGHTARAENSVIPRDSVLKSLPAQSEAVPRSHPPEPGCVLPQAAALNEQ